MRDELLKPICLTIWAFCFLCVLSVSLTFGHDAPIPAEIIPKAPRLEEHDNRVIAGEKVHFHAWCYDTIAGNGNQSGWWMESYPIEHGEVLEKVVVAPSVVVEPSGVHPSGVARNIPSPASGFGGTSRDVVSPPVVDPAPVPERSPRPPPPIHIVLTEIMFLDFAAGPGNPQWFELYNRGTDTNLSGFTLTFLTHSDGTYTKGGQDVVVIGEYLLRTGEAVIVTNKRLPPRPWLRNIDAVIVAPIRNLKNRWVLTDATGKDIYTRHARWHAGWGRHTEAGNLRQSVQIVPSAAPDAVYFYGSKWDNGTPGWHEDVAPAAPILQRPKRVTLWGALKQ